MTCRELTDFLMDDRTGDLAADVRSGFEAHLRECPHCVAYLRDYDATVRAARDAFDDQVSPVPDDLPEELVEAIVASRRNDARAGPGSRRR